MLAAERPGKRKPPREHSVDTGFFYAIGLPQIDVRNKTGNV
jgi:hypothetical protein